jgi:hypothetical protein
MSFHEAVAGRRRTRRGLAMTSQRDAGERLVVHRRMHSGS